MKHPKPIPSALLFVLNLKVLPGSIWLPWKQIWLLADFAKDWNLGPVLEESDVVSASCDGRLVHYILDHIDLILVVIIFSGWFNFGIRKKWAAAPGNFGFLAGSGSESLGWVCGSCSVRGFGTTWDLGFWEIAILAVFAGVFFDGGVAWVLFVEGSGSPGKGSDLGF